MPTVTVHPAGTPCWVDLMTPDPERARDFYEQALDWAWEIGAPETGPYSTAIDGGRPAAGVGPIPKGIDMPSAWTVYFGSEDLEASAAEIASLGGRVTVGPMDVLDQGRLLVAADPTGAVFGMWQPKVHRGFQVTGEPGAFAWCEVHTPQAEQARDFYAKLLQLAPEPMPVPSGTYHTLKRDGTPHAGVMPIGADATGDRRPHWRVYFAVADADEVCVRIDAAGGAIGSPPVDTPYGRMATVADPFGAVFAIIALPPAR